MLFILHKRCEQNQTIFTICNVYREIRYLFEAIERIFVKIPYNTDTKITIPMITNLIAIVFIVIAILMAIPKLVMSSQQKLKTSQDKIKNIKNPFPLKKSRD